jgi:hypothetical protein
VRRINGIYSSTPRVGAIIGATAKKPRSGVRRRNIGIVPIGASVPSDRDCLPVEMLSDSLKDDEFQVEPKVR